ncbi:MAG TPA: carboxypeptidase-like regulatory domain-containing protein [Caldilineaceae bacterium]|nr:carboxypeptidase-like regulatory domain-containing protein [Caldilineaceae bacterium]
MQQNGKPEKTITKQATIQGHVRNDQNAGVPNVSVSYGDNGDIATHSTNSSGFYKFTGVDAEIGNTEYQVKIKTIPNGYRCTTAALVNVKVYPGAVKTVDFALAPATASNQNSSSGPPPSSPPLRFADQRQLRGFRFDGRQIIEVKCDPTGTVAEQLLTPPYTSADRMMFLDEPVVFADEQTEDPNQLLAQFGNSKLAILNKTPGRFRLLTPHQEAQFEFFSQFFFQDGQRSYYVVPAVFFDLASYWKAVF